VSCIWFIPQVCPFNLSYCRSLAMSQRSSSDKNFS
jgi:hypothetical protein